MKLAILNICLRPDYKVRYLPVGLAYVLTKLKQAGIEFDLIDMDVNTMRPADLIPIFEREMYDAIGMGTIVTGLKTIYEIGRIAREINPKVKLFAGNSVASSITDIFLRNTAFDIAVISEADNTIVELIKALRGEMELGEVAGLAFLKDDRVFYTKPRPTISCLDDLGYPDWEIFDMEKYAPFLRTNSFGSDKANSYGTAETDVYAFPVNTARGCPYRCTFCYHEFIGKKYRRYSDAAIGRQIAHLHDKYGCNYVCLWDEISFLQVKGVRSFIDMLMGLDFKIGWEAPCRTDLFRTEHLPLIRDLAASGCGSLVFSLENADGEILDAMKKKITASHFIEQATVLQKGGVTPKTGVIFGYPQETEETIAKTVDLCYEAGMFPSVGYLLPLPGTPIYDWAKQAGHIKNEFEYLMSIGDRQDFSINLTQMSDAQFQDAVHRNLERLAGRQGLKLPSFLKTTRPPTPEASKAAIAKNRMDSVTHAVG